MPTTSSGFELATAITSTPPGTHAADLDPLWTVAGKPNGGYLQAIMARAATHDSRHPHVVAASTHFLHAPDPGPVRLEAETLRTGRTMTQVRVRLSQDDQPQVESLFTLGDLSASGTTPSWQSDNLPAPGLPFDQCPRFLPPPEVFPVELLRQVSLHVEPASLSFVSGEPRGLGELRAWLDLPGTQTFDPVSLLFAADATPPPTFDVKITGWVPTLELSTYVRALPAPGPVQIVVRANLVQGNRVDETATIRDSEGAVVAQAHQLAGIRFD